MTDLAIFLGTCPLGREARPLTIKGHEESGEIGETAYLDTWHASTCLSTSVTTHLTQLREALRPKETCTTADGNQAEGTSFTAGPVAPSKPKAFNASISASVETPSAKTSSPML